MSLFFIVSAIAPTARRGKHWWMEIILQSKKLEITMPKKQTTSKAPGNRWWNVAIAFLSKHSILRCTKGRLNALKICREENRLFPQSELTVHERLSNMDVQNAKFNSPGPNCLTDQKGSLKGWWYRHDFFSTHRLQLEMMLLKWMGNGCPTFRLKFASFPTGHFQLCSANWMDTIFFLYLHLSQKKQKRRMQAILRCTLNLRSFARIPRE